MLLVWIPPMRCWLFKCICGNHFHHVGINRVRSKILGWSQFPPPLSPFTPYVFLSCETGSDVPLPRQLAHSPHSGLKSCAYLVWEDSSPPSHFSHCFINLFVPLWFLCLSATYTRSRFWLQYELMHHNTPRNNSDVSAPYVSVNQYVMSGRQQ